MKKKPTAAELEILGVLWREGPCTVRQVHEALEGQRETGYTTILKLMQIMADKGLLWREESGRAHVYRAAVKREETQAQLLDDLMEKAFGGSAAALVMRALERSKASDQELREIRAMLDRYEGGRR